MQELDPVRQLAQVARPMALHARSRRTSAEVEVVSLRATVLPATRESEVEYQSVLEHLSATLRADAALLYTPELGARGWELTRCVWIGARAEHYSRELRRALRNRGPDAAAIWDYDPFAVEAAQRNLALTRNELHASPEAEERHRQLFGPLALAHCDQLRVLICDGPRLLAWVGVLRERAFEPDEARVLQVEVEPLRRMLKRDWNRETACLNRSLFECLLETVQGPALVLSERGRVEFANSVALAWLDGDDGASTLVGLRSAIARGSEHPGFTVIKLDERGCPGYSLVLRAQAAPGGAADRAVANKTRLWGLDSRQAAVLERVAQGQSNKEIAAAVGCAEVTVERVLTRLLRLSGSRSRTEMISRLQPL